MIKSPITALIDVMKRLMRLPHIATYLSFSLASSALGFIAVIALSHLLLPAQFGTIGVFLSLLYFVAPLISLSADGLIAVNKASLSAAEYTKFQNGYVALSYLCFLILQLAFAAAWLLGFYGDALLLFTPLFGLARFLASMAATEYVAEQRPIAYGMTNLLTSLLSLGLTVLFIHFFGSWGGFRILALFMADVMMLVVRYSDRIRMLMRPRWDAEVAGQILRFGLPSVIAIAGAWALNESDKIIVAREAGMTEAGVYSAAAALAAIMLIFNQSLTNAMYPEMFRRLTGGEHLWKVLIRYTCTFVGMSTIFSTLVVVAYILFGDQILPAHYMTGRPVFVALMVSGIAVSCYRPFALLADYYKLARVRAFAVIIGGSVTICIAYFGVKQSGPIWAAIGIACGYLTMIPIMATGLYWRHTKAS